MWLVTCGKETILHNGKNTFHDITLYTHVHTVVQFWCKHFDCIGMKSARSVKFPSTVSVQSQMDGNCVKYKLYRRWKRQFARKHRLYGGQTDTNTFIEARVPVRPLYPSVHFPDHPLPHHLDHLHPQIVVIQLPVFFLVLSFHTIFAGGVCVLQAASFDVTVLFCFLLLCLTL